jgi:hypothetical protein
MDLRLPISPGQGLGRRFPLKDQGAQIGLPGFKTTILGKVKLETEKNLPIQWIIAKGIRFRRGRIKQRGPQIQGKDRKTSHGLLYKKTIL